MGRSRAVTQPADEDLGQRSKRKRTTSNADNSEAASACHGGAEGKKALYHCNYCNKDISGKIRIKCAACSDFDLCVECFSIGAEVHPHKSNHPYRVMDNLSFPLICPDWNADDEMLLLEGIEMYGLGNWAEVAEHVGTKSKSMCIDHYKTDYMNSTCFPLPDMSRVMGKNREELLAMAREHGEIKKEGDVKEELSFSARFKAEDQKNNSLVVRSSSHIAPDSHADRSVGEKKLRISADESPMVITEISGYDPKRQEFEIEYDNGAETLLAEMEFKETDSEAEHELKMRVLRIYCKRLDERKRRKNFILERNLLNPDLFEKGLSQEEKNICNNYRVFMRFHSKEEHEALLRSLIEEHRLMKRIQYLQEASTAGCLTSSDVEKYIKLKVKMEGGEMSCRAKEVGPQVSSSGKYLQRANHLKGGGDIDNNSPRGASAAIRGAMILDSGPLLASSSPSSAPPCGVAPDVWDVSEFSGAELLSDTEIRLCGEMRILPNHYLYMLETMAIGILSGNITKKSDAYRFFNVDSIKVDKVYDMLEHKGIFPKP